MAFCLITYKELEHDRLIEHRFGQPSSTSVSLCPDWLLG